MKLKPFKWKTSDVFRFKAWVFNIPEIDCDFLILNVSIDKDGNFLDQDGLNYEIYINDRVEPFFWESSLKKAKEKVQEYVETYCEDVLCAIDKLKLD